MIRKRLIASLLFTLYIFMASVTSIHVLTCHCEVADSHHHHHADHCCATCGYDLDFHDGEITQFCCQSLHSHDVQLYTDPKIQRAELSKLLNVCSFGLPAVELGICEAQPTSFSFEYAPLSLRLVERYLLGCGLRAPPCDGGLVA